MAASRDSTDATRRYLDPNATEGLRHHYPTAFAATDISALIMLPGFGFRSLGNLAALSISSHRDTFPVTSISRVGVKGFTQGHRTIAGTLVFHTLDRGALLYGVNARNGLQLVNQETVGAAPMADTLPLFDIHINYVSESGALSFEALIGVRILDFGKTLSLENLHPVESYSYMALEYRPMEAVVDQAVMPKLKFTPRNREQLPITKLGTGYRSSSSVDPATLASPGALLSNTIDAAFGDSGSSDSPFFDWTGLQAPPAVGTDSSEGE